MGEGLDNVFVGFDTIYEKLIAPALIYAFQHLEIFQTQPTGETDPKTGEELYKGADGEKYMVVRGDWKEVITDLLGNKKEVFVPNEDGEEELILIPDSYLYNEIDENNETTLWGWDEKNKYFSKSEVVESGVGDVIAKPIFNILKKIFPGIVYTSKFAWFERNTRFLSKMTHHGKKLLHFGKDGKWGLTQYARHLPNATLAGTMLLSLAGAGAKIGMDLVSRVWKIAEVLLGVNMTTGMISFIGEEGVQGSGMNVYQAASHKELPPSALRSAIDSYITTVNGASSLHNTFGWHIARPSFDLFFQASKDMIPTYEAIYAERQKLFEALGPKGLKKDAWVYVKNKGKIYIDTLANQSQGPEVIGVSEGEHFIWVEQKGHLPQIVSHKFKIGEIFELYLNLEKSHYIKSISSGKRWIIDNGKRIILEDVEIGDPLSMQKTGKEIAAKSYAVTLTHGKPLEVVNTGKTEEGIEIVKVYTYEIIEGKIEKIDINEKMKEFLEDYLSKHPEEYEPELDLSGGTVEIEGRCTEVEDGDTAKVTVYDPEWKEKGIDPHTILGTYTIRFDCIDAPEIAHGRGKSADFNGHAVKDLLSWMIEKEYLTVKICCQDKYKRYVGKLYFKNVCINEVLVKMGAARCLREYLRPGDESYIEYEEEAKKEGRGIWKFSHKKEDKWEIPDEIYEAKGVKIKTMKEIWQELLQDKTKTK